MRATVLMGGGWIYVCSGSGADAEVGGLLLEGREVVLPLGEYDRDLGMPTLDAITRQLRVDLPRSLVRVDGTRTVDPDRILRSTFYPRLCTQASMAPVVEWFLGMDRVAHEVAQPLVIDVTPHTLHVRKRLGLRTWEGTDACTVTVTLAAHLPRQTLTVAVRRHLD